MARVIGRTGNGVHLLGGARVVHRARSEVHPRSEGPGTRTCRARGLQLALAAAIEVPASDDDRYPTWMVAAALGALGLAPLAVAWAVPGKVSSEWLSATSAGRALPFVLVIAESPASPTWDWPASGVYGALVVTGNQLESLARAFGGIGNVRMN